MVICMDRLCATSCFIWALSHTMLPLSCSRDAAPGCETGKKKEKELCGSAAGMAESPHVRECSGMHLIFHIDKLPGMCFLCFCHVWLTTVKFKLNCSRLLQIFAIAVRKCLAADMMRASYSFHLNLFLYYWFVSADSCLSHDVYHTAVASFPSSL